MMLTRPGARMITAGASGPKAACQADNKVSNISANVRRPRLYSMAISVEGIIANQNQNEMDTLPVRALSPPRNAETLFRRLNSFVCQANLARNSISGQSCRNGLNIFSYPIVVSGPWPG